MSEEESLQDRAINATAKLVISSQFDDFQTLDVSVHSESANLVKGELETVEISGKGMVNNQELRMEKLDIKTGKISVKPLLAAIGNVKLQEPTEATVAVVLNEQDINDVFDYDYIQEKLQGFPVTVDRKPLTLDAQQVYFSLPGEGRVKLSIGVLFRETGENRQVEFTAIPKVQADGTGVHLQEIEYLDGQEISPEMTHELLTKLESLLNISDFELSSGMSVRLRGLKVIPGQVHLEAQAYIEKIPRG
ncbi:MAG: LmeA family phospholipid-binding protein [Planktothrix sp.]